MATYQVTYRNAGGQPIKQETFPADSTSEAAGMISSNPSLAPPADAVDIDIKLVPEAVAETPPPPLEPPGSEALQPGEIVPPAEPPSETLPVPPPPDSKC